MRSKIRFMVLAIALAASADAMAETAVRVATWNISSLNDKAGEALGGRAPVRTDEDYELLGRYRERLNADVVALQEMGNPAAVARVFPPDEYEIIFSGRFEPANEADLYTALAVRKAKVGIVQAGDYEELSVLGEDFRPTRHGVEALLEVDGNRFWVMSIHLKSGCPTGSLKPAIDSNCTTLAKQIDPLEAWIDEKDATGLPVIVMGEFNRKFDVHGRSDHLWGDIDDRDPEGLDLYRLPYWTRSECPTARESNRRDPVDFLVFNQSAWEKVDEQSHFELLYDEADVPLGRRLSDHCPRAVEMRLGADLD